jgi:hypothetical protein
MTDIFDAYPRPWFVDVERKDIYNPCQIYDDTGDLVTTTEDGVGADVAQAIVSAVNAEPALRARVAVLEGALREALNSLQMCCSECSVTTDEIRDIINAALADAKTGE